MMNNTFILKLLICKLAILSSFSLFGEIEDAHVEVGSRVLSMEEHVAAQQKREALSVENISEENQAEENQVDENAQSNLDEADKICHHSYFYTSHPGVYHQAIAVSHFGETVELEDGSVWSIHSWDHHKTLDWLASDILIISPNHSWFSSYLFRITNQNTGASVEANLSLGPIFNGLKTHWIIGIDYYNNLVFLEDGSSWNMSAFDSSVVSHWLTNDTVIIGINDGWLSTTRPNVLINVNMLDYACGVSSY